MALTEIPIELSSTPGIVDNSNATAITIDSSENVGIGTSSANIFSTGGAANVLGVKSTTGGLISIAATGTNFSGVDLGTDAIRRGGVYSLNGSHLAFYTNATNSGTSLTERMRIDASGNILFGSTAQGYINGAATNTYNSGYNQDDDSWATWINYSGYQGGTTRYRDLIVGDGKNGRVATFDGSTGNVGIGVVLPARPLHVSTSGVIPLRLTSTGTDCQIELGNSGGTPIIGSFNDQLIFNTASTERMRIDSSGRLLIGKAVADSISTDGIELDGANDRVLITRSDSEPLVLNRKTSDGDIAVFRKDGTAVGSITSRGGATLGLILNPASSTGAGLSGTSNAIFPVDETTTPVNDQISLGTTNNRFKDLFIGNDIAHLDAADNPRLLYDKSANLLGNAGTNVEAYNIVASLGIYLGGTTAVNLLDDYEEGEYEVTITCGTSGTVNLNTAFNRAAYTKVGRLVTVHAFVVPSSVSSPVGFFKINLPFTPASLTDRAGDSAVSLVIQNVVSANISDFVGTINENDAFIYVQLGDASTVQNDSAQQLAANTYIHFSATYSTA